ncbi:hypothetical protein [Paenibacillus herberti]|uniref:Uncharacterized protein n=1 Tax=Paenibacillus herberti TaxID=1619309 RepID=A0A229P584_9BACL|nr:hypothetical protein [Paenibacillus herberti]OXM17075.1 hypothetical protein CGZ75_10735 [Paenibacillus herberti]
MEEQNKAINSRGGLLTGEPAGSEEASGETASNTAEAVKAEQVEAWAVSGAAATNSELGRPPEWQVFYDAMRQAADRMRRQ